MGCEQAIYFVFGVLVTLAIGLIIYYYNYVSKERQEYMDSLDDEQYRKYNEYYKRVN